MSPRRFVAAAANLNSKNDRDANLEVTRTLAARAAAEGTRLFCLPECFAFIGTYEAEKFPITERLDPADPGPILATVLDIAAEHDMWVSAGGLPERIESQATSKDGDVTTAYNTHIVVAPNRSIVARYRKIHLFDIDIPGQTTLRESDSTSAGDELVVAETELGRLGLSICYDLRFPELYRTLAINRGAEVLLVPAAFTAHTGAAHWHTLLRARAIENQCWVIAAAQAGKHNERRESFGHGLIIDPWGRVVADCEDDVGLAVAEIDLDKVASVRKNMPCHSHRTLRFE